MTETYNYHAKLPCQHSNQCIIEACVRSYVTGRAKQMPSPSLFGNAAFSSLVSIMFNQSLFLVLFFHLSIYSLACWPSAYFTLFFLLVTFQFLDGSGHPPFCSFMFHCSKRWSDSIPTHTAMDCVTVVFAFTSEPLFIGCCLETHIRRWSYLTILEKAEF